MSDLKGEAFAHVNAVGSQRNFIMDKPGHINPESRKLSGRRPEYLLLDAAE